MLSVVNSKTTHGMMNTNGQAAKIIADVNMGHEQVPQYLNVSMNLVKRWFRENCSVEAELMSDSDLYFLKYCLMTDDTRAHLF